MSYRMQSIVAAVAIAASCAAPALAQTTANPPPPPGHFQEMRGMHRQIERIEMQTRSQIVSALSPAHQALLASIAGQLAIAPRPDMRSSIERLNAALSSSEKQAILNADASARTQIRSMFANAHPGDQSQGPGAGNQRPPMGGPAGGNGPMSGAPMNGGPMNGGGPMGGPPMAGQRPPHRAPDAGSVLLRYALMVPHSRRA